VFLLGTVLFSVIQSMQTYEGKSTVIHRLKRIQNVANILFVFAGISMVDTVYTFTEKWLGNPQLFYSIFYGKWIVVMLGIDAIYIPLRHVSAPSIIGTYMDITEMHDAVTLKRLWQIGYIDREMLHLELAYTHRKAIDETEESPYGKDNSYQLSPVACPMHTASKPAIPLFCLEAAGELHTFPSHKTGEGKDKEDVGYILDALQAMDDSRLTLVGLHRLDHAEEHGAQKEHPARGFHQRRINLFQHKAARTDNHQHAAQQKQSTLYFIQLFHLSYFLFLFVHTLLYIDSVIICRLRYRMESLSSSSSSISTEPGRSVLSTKISSLSAFIK
jgi:hypothetical protein